MLICVISTFQDDDCLPRAARSAWDAGVDDVRVFEGPWDGFTPEATETQAEKRTRMFHECGAHPGDLILSLDADEELDGTFPELPVVHHNLWLQNTGPNDLPGVRLDWPLGDGGITPFPLLRLFAYTAGLRCVCGGVWADETGLIEPYNGDTTSRLPVVDGVRILHHAHERALERQQRKRDYYLAEHPRRRQL